MKSLEARVGELRRMAWRWCVGRMVRGQRRLPGPGHGADLSHNGLEGRLPNLGRLSQIELRIGDKSGRLPLSLSSLPALREFHYADTELCAPVEAGFQAAMI